MSLDFEESFTASIFACFDKRERAWLICRWTNCLLNITKIIFTKVWLSKSVSACPFKHIFLRYLELAYKSNTSHKSWLKKLDLGPRKTSLGLIVLTYQFVLSVIVVTFVYLSWKFRYTFIRNETKQLTSQTICEHSKPFLNIHKTRVIILFQSLFHSNKKMSQTTRVDP